ncbi:hypothetical protein OCU04_006190 [Sclerotinia nivalis]|uniref:Uncharacterized protein n=1 Tax=Sclerotinia nivalis TaxID=352851 RepID=A0A9X0DJR5_9HELO|nr:hypothetical protein OCU04_006190 [Sclerotinia nivalis]
MPTRPDWLPIEFQLLGNDGFTYEDIDRCANLLRNASNVGEPSQVESNAKSKLYVEKSPQITGSPSTHPADGPTQRSPNTTHQRRLLPEYSQQARTSNNSGAAFDSAGMANPFKANASTIGLRPLSYYMGRTSASVASTGFGHTYTSDYSNHAQQPQNTFENKETAATNIIGEIAEGAALGINSSVFNGNPSSGIPFLPSWNFQSVTQDYNPATQAYGVQPVNTSEFSGTSLSYTIGSDTFQTPPFASTFEQFWNTQNFANNYPLAAYVPQVRPTGTELGCGQSDLL